MVACCNCYYCYCLCYYCCKCHRTTHLMFRYLASQPAIQPANHPAVNILLTGVAWIINLHSISPCHISSSLDAFDRLSSICRATNEHSLRAYLSCFVWETIITSKNPIIMHCWFYNDYNIFKVVTVFDIRVMALNVCGPSERVCLQGGWCRVQVPPEERQPEGSEGLELHKKKSDKGAGQGSEV